MGTKKAIRRNVVWNTAGLVAETGAGFLVLPYLIVHLGQEVYGVWIVLGALMGYFGLLDLGIRGAVGRHVAFYHSRGDQEGLNRTLTGGMTFLSAVAVAAVAAILAGQSLFFQVFDIPPPQHETVQLALQLVAVQLALFLVSTGFDATLWGCQRFDWLNMVDIPAVVLRTGLTFALVRSPEDMPTLAWIAVGVTAGTCVAKGVLCYRAVPGLRVRPRYLTRDSLRELFHFGSWNLVTNVAVVSRRQFTILLIGALLGVMWTAPFSVAERLLGAATAALVAVTGVLTPYATSLYATGRVDAQRRLFLEGGRVSAAMAVLLTSLLIVLGGPLINLWVGAAMAPAAGLLIVIAAGEMLSGTQHITKGMVVAAGQHRALALCSILDAAAVCGITAVVCPVYGLQGIGWAIAIPAVLSRGVAPLVQGCRLVGVGVWEYIGYSIAPAVLCCLLPAAVLWVLLGTFPVDSWAKLVAYGGLYTVLFGAGLAILVLRRPLKGSSAVAESRQDTHDGRVSPGAEASLGSVDGQPVNRTGLAPPDLLTSPTAG
ncbi:lipopolysaccharide biosynthesis protein [Urbifossiella limnaea]|uniref:Putative membrane protein EpsK n=1 Tax=Urbifossiella limnaea TaxID=2528023 RepID=A0A517Y333_9BACT|nr:oligosaccharide flippase family protein [Urbifossiella limnaea]QDU24149.1 putative membrane protein EpsK [Urbifossiella limnaea]